MLCQNKCMFIFGLAHIKPLFILTFDNPTINPMANNYKILLFLKDSFISKVISIQILIKIFFILENTTVADALQNDLMNN